MTMCLINSKRHEHYCLLRPASLNADAGPKRRESNVYIWFRGKDVATVLGYANTIQALIKNVDEDDKKKMDGLGNPCEGLPDPNARKTMFINESGHYS